MAFLGHEIIPYAVPHIGERYILGARAPVLNPNWRGPWDCAEFATWCAYQAYKILFGTSPRDARKGDAYTGYWWQDSAEQKLRIPVAKALSTPGAFLLRQPRRELIGHIAISLGDGRVVEAGGRKIGVVLRKNTPDRRWDTGVLLPGVQYTDGGAQAYVEPTDILRVVDPYMRSPAVAAVQRALAVRDFDPGDVDGIFGELTEAAVIAFQTDRGLIVDGEVGPQTAEELGLSWPIVPTAADQAVLNAATPPIPVGTAPVASAPLPGQALQFTFKKVSGATFATEASDPEQILIGRETSYSYNGRSYKGLAHRKGTDLALIKPYGFYNRFKEEATHGLWAHFLWPTIVAESGGYYARINTYDAGFCTFGMYQLAAHTPGENLAELFRALLKLSDAPAYFPDLTLVNGKVHRRVNEGTQDLEQPVVSNGLRTSALAVYLNPSTAGYDQAEMLANARLIHWVRRNAAARTAQMDVAVAIAKRKLRIADAKLDLSGRPLDQCIWVSDVLHQGRGTYVKIRSALDDHGNELQRLMGIGVSFRDRIRTVGDCVAELHGEGTIDRKTFDDLW